MTDSITGRLRYTSPADPTGIETMFQSSTASPMKMERATDPFSTAADRMRTLGTLLYVISLLSIAQVADRIEGIEVSSKLVLAIC